VSYDRELIILII